jgi:hypothetical protein
MYKLAELSSCGRDLHTRNMLQIIEYLHVNNKRVSTQTHSASQSIKPAIRQIHVKQLSLLKLNILLFSCFINHSHLYTINHCHGNTFIHCPHILWETVQYLSWKRAADINTNLSVMRTKRNTIYLFIFIILTNTATVFWMRLNNELGRMWEMPMAQPGGTNENHVKPVRIVSVFQLAFKLSTSCLHVMSTTVDATSSVGN